jgi:hypothetical protein
MAESTKREARIRRKVAALLNNVPLYAHSKFEHGDDKALFGEGGLFYIPPEYESDSKQKKKTVLEANPQYPEDKRLFALAVTAYCFESDNEPPQWAKEIFVECHGKVDRAEVMSLDAAFGTPYSGQFKNSVELLAKLPDVLCTIEIMINETCADEAIDDKLYQKIGRLFGCHGTSIEQIKAAYFDTVGRRVSKTRGMG